MRDSTLKEFPDPPRTGTTKIWKKYNKISESTFWLVYGVWDSFVFSKTRHTFFIITFWRLYQESGRKPPQEFAFAIRAILSVAFLVFFFQVETFCFSFLYVWFLCYEACVMLQFLETKRLEKWPENEILADDCHQCFRK